MHESSEIVTDKPKLIVPLGRGSRGKTFWVRWAVERAQSMGREVVIADMDRTNATLSSFFTNVVSPPSGDDRDVREFMGEFIERQIEQRFTAVLDLGGGDTILKSVARQSKLVEFLSTNGIEPVVVHMIGPAIDDLAFLRDVEEDLAPPATILILNEGMVPPHRTAAAAFESTVGGNPILISAIERGARLLRMPRLEPAADIDTARLGFGAAEDGKKGVGSARIGLWKRQQIALWRRAMEDEFGGVASWLP